MYARLTTRDTAGLHPNLRGLSFLGDASSGAPMTPDEAVAQAIQEYSGYHLNPRDFQNNSFLQLMSNTVKTAKINYTPCANSAPPMNLLQTANGLAMGAAGATTGILVATQAIAASTGAILGAATMGVGLIISVIAMIFAHHAAAVKRDAAFECSSLPAVNNAFAVVQQAVQSGVSTPADAAASLDEIYSQFMAAGGASGGPNGPGSIPSGGTAINDSPYCNSNCEMSVSVRAMVIYWKAQYETLAAQQAAEAASAEATSSSVATAPDAIAATAPLSEQTAGGAPAITLQNIPKWAWILAGVAAIWAVA
jgi:hypothetical protein